MRFKSDVNDLTGHCTGRRFLTGAPEMRNMSQNTQLIYSVPAVAQSCALMSIVHSFNYTGSVVLSVQLLSCLWEAGIQPYGRSITWH